MDGQTMRIGSLIKTGVGVYGVIQKFNQKDNLYTISWANGMRQGENVNYDKKTIDYLLKEGGWMRLSPEGKRC